MDVSRPSTCSIATAWGPARRTTRLLAGGSPRPSAAGSSGGQGTPIQASAGHAACQHFNYGVVRGWASHPHPTPARDAPHEHAHPLRRQALLELARGTAAAYQLVRLRLQPSVARFEERICGEDEQADSDRADEP